MTEIEEIRDTRIGRKLALLITEATTLRRQNEDLKRRLKITEGFVPVQSQRSLEIALGEREAW